MMKSDLNAPVSLRYLWDTVEWFERLMLFKISLGNWIGLKADLCVRYHVGGPVSSVNHFSISNINNKSNNASKVKRIRKQSRFETGQTESRMCL